MRDKALRDAKEEQQELEALHRLDEECVHQQRAGNYLKAFDCMERALVLRRHFFGIDSREVIQACRALAEMCNLLAMSFLQQDNYAVTIDLLKKAEVLTQHHHPDERATTLNNLACYYRRLGKLHSAMTNLKRALELEKGLANVRNAADTQLNMCAVLSQLGKHQEALEHAQEALITLQEGFIQSKHTTDAAPTDADTNSSKLDRISVMCIAYHNIGVEQEYLKDYAESVASYKKGVGLAEQYLGAEHSIATTIRNSYLAAKRTMATKTKAKPCSAGRDQRSSAKAGARHLQSPRNGSLRMPSPLAKEKERRNVSGIPTPRSIIADALSRGPLSALPPLEIQSPPSASKKKKVTTTIESKGKNSLSPTDPFFSPRFRFENGTDNSQMNKSQHADSPVAPGVGTPASRKGTRERRKSNVKNLQTTPGVGGAATRKSSRTKTAQTPRSNTKDVNVRMVSPSNEREIDKVSDEEIVAGPSTDYVTLEQSTQLSIVEPSSEYVVSTSKHSTPAREERNDGPAESENLNAKQVQLLETSQDRPADEDSQEFNQNSKDVGDKPKQEVEGEVSTSLAEPPEALEAEDADGAIAPMRKPTEGQVVEQETTGFPTVGEPDGASIMSTLVSEQEASGKTNDALVSHRHDKQDAEVGDGAECQSVDNDNHDIAKDETVDMGNRGGHEVLGSAPTDPSLPEDATVFPPELTVEIPAAAHGDEGYARVEDDTSVAELASNDLISRGDISNADHINVAKDDGVEMDADPESALESIVIAEIMPQADSETMVHQDEMATTINAQHQVSVVGEEDIGDNIIGNDAYQDDVGHNGSDHSSFKAQSPHSTDPWETNEDNCSAAHELEESHAMSNTDESTSASAEHDAQYEYIVRGSNEDDFYAEHNAQEYSLPMEAEIEANEVVNASPHEGHLPSNTEFYDPGADNGQLHVELEEPGDQFSDPVGMDWGHAKPTEHAEMEAASNYDYYSEEQGPILSNEEQPLSGANLPYSAEHTDEQLREDDSHKLFIDGLVEQENTVNADPEVS